MNTLSGNATARTGTSVMSAMVIYLTFACILKNVFINTYLNVSNSNCFQYDFQALNIKGSMTNPALV